MNQPAVAFGTDGGEVVDHIPVRRQEPHHGIIASIAGGHDGPGSAKIDAQSHGAGKTTGRSPGDTTWERWDAAPASDKGGIVAVVRPVLFVAVTLVVLGCGRGDPRPPAAAGPNAAVEGCAEATGDHCEMGL